MGFLCRQGRIRKELVVGLLIVIGTMLEGSEGLKCYQKLSAHSDEKPVNCQAEQTVCLTETNDRVVVLKVCAAVHKCKDEVYGPVDCFTLTPETQSDFLRCVANSGQGFREGRTTTQNATEDSPPNILVGRTSSSSQGRQLGGTIRQCICKTNLCNPAGRSAPNAQVILGVLVAATLTILKIATGAL